MKQPHFLHVDTNSQKLKVVQKFFGSVCSKYRSGWSDLQLTVSPEWTDEINWFLHAGTNLCKLKEDWKFMG